MSFIADLKSAPSPLSAASRYTALNGVVYMASGALLMIWPGAAQAILRDAEFVGHEAGLMRVLGMTVAIIGWLYFFGGRSGGRQVIAASVLDRLIVVPIVLVPLALCGVFPHTLGSFAIFDPMLGLGAWVVMSRGRRP